MPLASQEDTHTATREATASRRTTALLGAGHAAYDDARLHFIYRHARRAMREAQVYFDLGKMAVDVSAQDAHLYMTQVFMKNDANMTILNVDESHISRPGSHVAIYQRAAFTTTPLRTMAPRRAAR